MLALFCAFHHPRQPLPYFPRIDRSRFVPVDMYTTTAVFPTIPLRNGDVHYVRSLRWLRTNTLGMAIHSVEHVAKCCVPGSSVMRSYRIAWRWSPSCAAPKSKVTPIKIVLSQRWNSSRLNQWIVKGFLRAILNVIEISEQFLWSFHRNPHIVRRPSGMSEVG